MYQFASLLWKILAFKYICIFSICCVVNCFVFIMVFGFIVVLQRVGRRTVFYMAFYCEKPV